MSIVRLQRDTTAEDGRRVFEYREAWLEPDASVFTVHHGRVGHPGTVGDQPVSGEEEGRELLAAFLAQGIEAGYAEADPETFDVVEVGLRLRGRTPADIERRHAEALREELTHQLAWRGLGEVTDVADGDGQLVLTVRTPHAAKACAEVPAAAKRAPGVQPNKVTARTVSRGGASAAGTSAADAEGRD